MGETKQVSAAFFPPKPKAFAYPVFKGETLVASTLNEGVNIAFSNIAIAAIAGIAVYLTILIYAKTQKLSRTAFKIADIAAKFAGGGTTFAMISGNSGLWPWALLAIAAGVLAAILLPKQKTVTPPPNNQEPQQSPYNRTPPITPAPQKTIFPDHKNQQDFNSPINIDIADSYTRKDKLLTAPEKLMYFILKAGMPDHEIFANVRLADVVNVSSKYNGFDKTARFRKISQYHLDFVVCKTDMTIIAAIEVDDKSHERPERQKADELKNECLKHVGIKLIRFKVGKFPRHHEVKQFVYGNRPASA